MKELRELHDKEALMLIKKEEMSYDDCNLLIFQQKSLRYLMFIKGKRDRSMKAQGCADGRPQCEYMTQSEAS